MAFLLVSYSKRVDLKEILTDQIVVTSILSGVLSMGTVYSVRSLILHKTISEKNDLFRISISSLAIKRFCNC